MLKRLGVSLFALLHSDGMYPVVRTLHVGGFDWIVPNTEVYRKENKQIL